MSSRRCSTDASALCRYIQLPINAGMREAWEPSWQSVRPAGAPPSDAASLKLPVTAAAAQLGLGVFASGSLGEGSLLRDRQLLVCACSGAVPSIGTTLGSVRNRLACAAESGP